MTTIRKNIDVSVSNYEVEIDLDASDLEKVDESDLWDALQEKCSTSELADFVESDDRLMKHLAGEEKFADLWDKIQDNGYEDKLAEAVVDDAEIAGEVIERASSEFVEAAIMAWIGPESLDSTREIVEQAVIGNLTPERRKRLLGEPSITVAEATMIPALIESIRSPEGATLAAVMEALVKEFGAGNVIGSAVASLESSCRGS